jgi:hypothetical protein
VRILSKHNKQDGKFNHEMNIGHWVILSTELIILRPLLHDYRIPLPGHRIERFQENKTGISEHLNCANMTK